MTLALYNTLTRRKEEFKPLDAKNVRMYVCGPTVYDRPHLGNARSVVVYDVLYRLLCHLYGKEHVTYVRNVTDVDDKINAAAKANGEPISALTARVEGWFRDDMAALNVLSPTREPHATGHIAQMIAMIEKLIAGGHAYTAKGHVLFDVTSDAKYGQLSGRKLDDLLAGARVEVESYKKHPGDFVLWKPADAGDDPSSVFDSPWGKGRPGWHIECSAMSTEYLGADFDIHGGGADLMFPHHENEIAQSQGALPGSQFARAWVHNGFLTVNGEKMSKSLGNFITVKDLLDKGAKGEVIRLALLKTKYNEPLDWSEKLLSDAKSNHDTLNYSTLFHITNRLSTSGRVVEHQNYSRYAKEYEKFLETGVWQHFVDTKLETKFYSALCDDLNTPLAIAVLFEIANHTRYMASKKDMPDYLVDPEQHFGYLVTLKKCAKMLGFDLEKEKLEISVEEQNLIAARAAAKKSKNFAEADRIRKELSEQGIILEDRPDGTTDWRRA